MQNPNVTCSLELENNLLAILRQKKTKTKTAKAKQIHLFYAVVILLQIL